MVKDRRHSRRLEETPFKGAKNFSLLRNLEKPALPFPTFSGYVFPNLVFIQSNSAHTVTLAPEVFVRKPLCLPFRLFFAHPNRAFPLFMSIWKKQMSVGPRRMTVMNLKRQNWRNRWRGPAT
jgi:hypothetical protein